MKQKTQASDPSISGGGGIPGYISFDVDSGKIHAGPIPLSGATEVDVETMSRVGVCENRLPLGEGARILVLSEPGAVVLLRDGKPEPFVEGEYSMVGFQELPAGISVKFRAPILSNGAFGVTRQQLNDAVNVDPRPNFLELIERLFQVGVASFYTRSLQVVWLEVLPTATARDVSVAGAHAKMELYATDPNRCTPSPAEIAEPEEAEEALD